MLEKVMDRLEGINPEKLNQELLKLVLTAEDMGLQCQEYLYQNGTRDALLKKYDTWQEAIDSFYEKYIR